MSAVGISTASVSGHYRGTLGRYKVDLVLKPDGTFRETVRLKDGKTLPSDGRWTISVGAVDFKNLLISSPGDTQLSLSDFGGAEVRLVDHALVFSDDTDEHLDRVR